MSIHNITKEMLKELGISPNLKAYKYLIKFFEMEANGEIKSDLITKEVYPAIAKKLNTKPTLVERAIRYAIQVSDTEALIKYSGYDFLKAGKGKLSNKQFLIGVKDYINNCIDDKKQ